MFMHSNIKTFMKLKIGKTLKYFKRKLNSIDTCLSLDKMYNYVSCIRSNFINNIQVYTLLSNSNSRPFSYIRTANLIKKRHNEKDFIAKKGKHKGDAVLPSIHPYFSLEIQKNFFDSNFQRSPLNCSQRYRKKARK